jgi:hypothetical protein
MATAKGVAGVGAWDAMVVSIAEILILAVAAFNQFR